MNKADLQKVRDALNWALDEVDYYPMKEDMGEALRILDAALAAPEPQPFMTLNVTDWHNGTKSYAFDGYPNNLPIGAYPLYTAHKENSK